MGHNSFSIVYIKGPRHALDLACLPAALKSVTKLVEDVRYVQEESRHMIIQSNARYKATADKHCWENVFEVGDLVMVYLRKE